jgi:hypothetical protein
MINRDEMFQLLCKTYPGFRDKVVEDADNWITDNGEFMLYPWMHLLCDLVVSRFNEGDYDRADELFSLVELLMTEGNEDIKNAIATGFLEGLQHQRELEPKYWAPLLGPESSAYCEAMDRFWGIKESGHE